MDQIEGVTTTEIFTEQLELKRPVLVKITADRLQEDFDTVATLVNISQDFQKYLVENGVEELRHMDLRAIGEAILAANHESEDESIDEILQRIAGYGETDYLDEGASDVLDEELEG
jgi:hypothetical protein